MGDEVHEDVEHLDVEAPRMKLGGIGLLLHGLHAATDEASAWGECVQYAADGVPSGGSESGGGSPGAIRAEMACITS